MHDVMHNDRFGADDRDYRLKRLRCSNILPHGLATASKALAGRRKGQYGIRINDQWRICFEWPDRAPGPAIHRLSGIFPVSTKAFFYLQLPHRRTVSRFASQVGLSAGTQVPFVLWFFPLQIFFLQPAYTFWKHRSCAITRNGSGAVAPASSHIVVVCKLGPISE
jgi:hypothetical protein